MIYDSTEYDKAISGQNHIKRKIKGKTCDVHQEIKAKRQQKITRHYVNLTLQLSFRNTNLKFKNHTGGKWSTHDPKHHKENRLLSLKHFY